MNKQCEETGKRCFVSMREAKRATRRLSARLRIYLCPFCHYHHYTSQHKEKNGGLQKRRTKRGGYPR